MYYTKKIMKIYTNNLFCIIALFLLQCLMGCQDEKGEEIVCSDRTAKIIVEYSNASGIYLDYNAHIFIYYGIYSTEIAGYNYISNGILSLNGHEVKPTKSVYLNGQSGTVLILDSSEKITILVESSLSKKNIMIHSYSPGNKEINHTFKFDM